MYSEEEISALLPEAESYVEKNDRSLYSPLLASVEEYCSAREVRVGNVIHLIKSQPDRSQYYLDIYAAFALTVAHEIAVKLSTTTCPHIPTNTTAVRTILKNEEFEIKVFDRIICRVFSIKSSGGINYISLLGDCRRPAIWAECKVRCLPPSIALIEVYRILYSPREFSLWEQNIKVLSALWDECGELVAEAKLAIELHGVHGGAEGHSPKEILSVLGYPIVCGDIALNKIIGNIRGGRLQIITDLAPSDVISRLRRIISGKLISVKYPINLPIDFQLQKHTIYSGRVPILDMYNSLSYELIPYKEIKGVCVAAPFVCMRFLLINLWLLRAVGIKSAATPLIENCARNISSLREYLRGAETRSLFLGWKYRGTSLNPTVVKNQRRAETGQFPVFYPVNSPRA